MIYDIIYTAFDFDEYIILAYSETIFIIYGEADCIHWIIDKV